MSEQLHIEENYFTWASTNYNVDSEAAIAVLVGDIKEVNTNTKKMKEAGMLEEWAYDIIVSKLTILSNWIGNSLKYIQENNISALKTNHANIKLYIQDYTQMMDTYNLFKN